MLLIPVAATAALAALCPQGPTLTAFVDDARSHGAVGDQWLSLDEAIRVCNGTLSLASLSAAEQARFTGSGTMLTRIVLDHALTPVVTLEAPLTPVMGAMGSMAMLDLVSNSMHGMPVPTLVGGAHAHVLSLRTHHVHVHGLAFDGGQVAIDAKMPAMAMPHAMMGMVKHCTFEHQTTAAVQLRGTGTDETMLMVHECEFEHLPVAFLLDDQTNGGMLMSENEHVHLHHVALGCRIVENGVGGNMTMWSLFRSEFEHGTTLAEVRRTPTSAQQCMLRIVHSNAHCSGDVLDVQGNTAGLTMVHHHHGDFVAGAGHKAFWVHPRTAKFDIHGSEMVLDGDVLVQQSLTSPRMWQQNNIYKNGTVTFDCDGALPNLYWNIYDNCSIHVPATARSPVNLRQCELRGTSAHGASFLAPIALTSCHRSGGAVTGFASEVQPQANAFLGRTSLAPSQPQAGGTLSLSCDLPFGIALVWDIAVPYARPTTTAEPVRLYADPATVIVLAAVLLHQSTMTVPIPNDPSLVGQSFYAQGIAVPLYSFGPAFHLPRGHEFLVY
jgi:hypothetical protein